MSKDVKQMGIHVPTSNSGLDYKEAGFSEQDLEKTFFIHDPKTQGITKDNTSIKLKDLVDSL